MSCWLCGHEKDDAHHLGCARIARPNLTKNEAVKEGLMPAPAEKKGPEEPKEEVLKEGSMTTVPVGEDEADEDTGDEEPAEGGETVGQCEVEGCHNPKYSASPRTKYCEEHKDPKNRKE